MVPRPWCLDFGASTSVPPRCFRLDLASAKSACLQLGASTLASGQPRRRPPHASASTHVASLRAIFATVGLRRPRRPGGARAPFASAAPTLRPSAQEEHGAQLRRSVSAYHRPYALPAPAQEEHKSHWPPSHAIGPRAFFICIYFTYHQRHLSRSHIYLRDPLP